MIPTRDAGVGAMNMHMHVLTLMHECISYLSSESILQFSNVRFSASDLALNDLTSTCKRVYVCV